MPTRFGPLRRLTLGMRICLFMVLLACFCAPAIALDQIKAAGNIARQAALAFEQGDHVRAAQLYLQAFATDPNMSDYLYGAARAEHIGAKTAMAEKHYAAFLEKTTSGARADNARKYLSELRAGQADQKVSEAERAERQGSFGVAAQLYRSARTLAPARWECLLREAVAREQGGDKAEAISLLEQYLRDAPKDARDRDEVSVRLAALRPRSEPSKPAVANAAPAVEPSKTAGSPVKVPAPTPVALTPTLSISQTSPPSDRSVQRITAWSVAGAGVAAGLTGLGLGLAAASDRSDLDAKLSLQNGKITQISYSEAVARDKSISEQRRTAAIVGGLGVAATATGTWLLWRAYRDEPSKVSVLPLGNGVMVSLRF